jgi:hypothetical protein
MVLWVAQARGALDRMTPNATTTQARLAARTPTDLTTAANRQALIGLEQARYAGAVAEKKRLSCAAAAGAHVEESVAACRRGTTTSLGRR